MGDNDSSARKTEEAAFFHPDLLEIPANGDPPYLKGYRCRRCGQLDFPKLNPCPTCWGEEFDVVPLSRRGRLYASSDNYVGQPGIPTPYTFGYIDLPENLRIFAQLEGEPGSFICDQEVELVLGVVKKDQEGRPITSYKFRKV